MRQYPILLFALFFLVATSCKRERDLQTSVFIEDETAPSLPIYSEWGYNTFGAYYDREPFVSSSYLLPFKVIVNGGKTNFIFQGNRYGNDITMTFAINGYLPAEYTDLVDLNGRSYDIKAPALSVTIKEFGVYKTVSILKGNLTFIRAQKLLIDEKQVEVILSGTFELQALIDSMPISISDGRFDMGIGWDNFYNY